MKNLFIKLYSIINTLYYSFIYKSVQQKNTIYFVNKLNGVINNSIRLFNTKIKYSSINIKGKDNTIIFDGCQVEKTRIFIFGNNNIIKIESNVKLNSSQIIIRGNNCEIHIGNGTTFGSAYMVCMGFENYIKIGSQCMFAENIEIWNSDTHPIYNNKGDIINKSKPVLIGNHIWFGKGCKILKGVTIGNNSIIGMGALVTKNIKPNTLNAGIPAITIKEEVNWDRNFIMI